jgi:pilus assembly protein CpaC
MLPVRANGAPRLLSPLCAVALVIAATTSVSAQTSTPPQSAATPGTPAFSARPATVITGDAEAGEVQLLVGRSAVLNLLGPITRVSLTRPEIADAMATGPQQLLIHGKMPGTISMFVWERSGAIRRYNVIVSRDLSELTEQMRQLFPGEKIAVSSNGKDVVISGTVSSKYVVEKAADVAAGYVEKKENVVNLLKQQEAIAANQVLLRVRFAEVSRNALTELGSSFFTGPNGYKDWMGRTTTEQFAAPVFDTDKGGLVFSDFLNVFLFNTTHQLGTVIRALQNKGLFQSLAEPNLIAENGMEASFLAGGEYPYPVAQVSSGNTAITIQFKEFGIRLTFMPTITGPDLIHLKVRPEVSSLDFANGVTLQGFRIPALSTRRAETEVELQDGQTFAIAGLMSNTVTSTMQKIPGIGDIPILGLLFRSKAAQKGQTELVVMITPQILKRGSTGVTSGLPNLVEPYLPPPQKTIPPPLPHVPKGSDETTGQPATTAAGPDAARPAATVAPAAAVPVPARVPAPPVQVEQAPRRAAQVESAPATTPTPVAVVVSEAAPPQPAAAAAQAQAAPPAAQRATVQVPTKQQLEQDKRALQQAQKELKKRQEAEAKARAGEEKRAAEQAKVDVRERKKQEEVEAKAREAEEKRAAEQARIEAKRAEEQARAEAKRNAEEAKLEARRGQELARAEQKRRAEEAKRAAEQAKLLQAKLEKARKEQEKLDRERAKREAQGAKVAEANARREAEIKKQREKDLADIDAKVKELQAAYEAALAAAKKGGPPAPPKAPQGQ